MKLENSYLQLPDSFYEKVRPSVMEPASLIAFNKELADKLDPELSSITNKEASLLYSGQKLFEGSEPIALAYAGFQFGHPVALLGDGRAHLLGQLKGYDLQLKGSGKTKFSRAGDGNSALGPVLREYIVSEAMHVLGVPTTRALAAVEVDKKIMRQFGNEPAGIFTRVAKSHLRVGSFQYYAFRNDKESLFKLLDYTLERHYPEISLDLSFDEKVLKFLESLCQKQADLIAKWSGLGFIHGVMNTDNFSVVPITIDYGPCAFMDEFEFNKVFSSIDRNGRYAFFNQTQIAKWNMLRLSECFIAYMSKDEKENISAIEELFSHNFDSFDEKRMREFARKLGITDYRPSDDKIVMTFLTYLEKTKTDFTLGFRNLDALFLDDTSFYVNHPLLDEFIKKWKDRVKSVSLKDVNPVIIPRNHLIEDVIDHAYEKNYKPFHLLLRAIESPFSAPQEFKDFTLPPKPSQKVKQTFCGT